jgi:DNA polymerase-1
VDLARLTQAQADSASYPLAMVGYLKWLAPQIETLKETVPPLLRKLASSLPAQHGRVQENAAKLLIGMNLFLAYAEEIGAVTGEERTALFREATRAFSEKAYVTGQKQAEKKPTNLFKDVLLNLIHQGEGYLACATTNSLPSQPKLYGYGDFSTQEEEIYRPREGAKQFGWVDEAEGIVYLIPEEVYQQTFDFTRRSGGMFPVQKHGFGSYLKQEKVLARWNDNRNDYRKRLGGRNRNVWALKKSFLFPNDSDEDNGSIEPTPTPADLIDLFSPSPNEAMSQPEEAFEHPAEVTENLSGESKVHIIKGASAIGAALNDLTAAPLIGLDLETTGLDPRKDKTRLLTLSSARNTYVLDCFETDPTPFFPVMSAPSTRLIGQNLAFDLSFLTGDGFEPGRVEDTMLLSQLLHSGLTFETKDGDDKLSKLNHGLAEIVKRELGLDLSKEEQKSDWSGRLSRSQLDYAAKDASILQPLYRKLREKIAVAGLEKAAEIERRCLPAMVWMRNAGVGFDWDGWRTLAEETEAEALRIAEEMDQIAPMPPGLDLGFGWQWDKNQIVQRVFKELGFDLHNTNDETLAGIDHPLADLLRKYRGLKIRMNAYGLNWEPYVEDGRIYSDWKQIGADSGRMASRDPNLQQVPGALKHPQYRKCLVAPPGRMLVKADYSQIELRIAAKIANERAMIAAYEQGEDLHILTARRLTGKDEITKEDRQIAKSANFGLLYGMAAEGYRIYAQTNYNVALSPEEAAAYRNAFFTGYPGLLKWHRSVRSSNSTETRTLAGRRRLLNEQTPYTHRLNTPVQGTGADGLKRALALLWERRDQCEGTFPVMAVHDEIVVECDEGQVAAAGEWLKTAMHDGMRALIAPVPVEVEVSAGRTWAGS